jgi:pilus assembly protein CpaB
VKRRALTVALAVLLAVLGTAGVLAYVRQADARALAGQKAVTVLVAHDLIPSGTSAGAALQDGLLSSQRLPAASVPSDAVRSITPDLSALVVSADVQPGQLMLRPMLATAAQVTGGLAIPSGMVAVTVQLCTPEAVAGNVHAGSQVAVFDTSAASGTLTAQPNCDLPHEQQASGAAHTRLELPRVLVLSVGAAAATGQTSSPSSSASSSTSSAVLVTLAVSQADAERLIQLTQTGLPYLALLTNSSQTRVDTTLVPSQGPPGQLPSGQQLPGKRPAGRPSPVKP